MRSELVLVRCVGHWCGNRPLRRLEGSTDRLCAGCRREFETLAAAGGRSARAILGGVLTANVVAFDPARRRECRARNDRPYITIGGA